MNDIVGALMARDYKGVGNEYVDEGKLVVQVEPCGLECDRCYEHTESKRWRYRGGGETLIENRKTVRRLTPLECERLQGYPDNWTLIGEPAGTEIWKDEDGNEYPVEIRKYRDSNGKLKKASDSARYKALGNSIALPPWRIVLGRICEHLPDGATMGSLFDGIGGFPLIWEEINGKGTAVWASEIEEFPMAVTKERFRSEDIE